MTNHLFRIRSFFTYWLEAVDEHSLHSPFFFDLYTAHIKSPGSTERFAVVESLRKKLLRDQRMIPVLDLGSGRKDESKRRISHIARTSLSRPRYSRIYWSLARHLDATSILELGTSFGINTLYLAEKSDATVTTFEGSPAIADIAALTFEFAGKKNIDLITGDITRTLPAFLQRVKSIDVAFIDANHRLDPTLQYFDWLVRKVHQRSIIIVDDIHHSMEMTRAWQVIKGHRLVYASADLFRCGILFFDPSLNKQHVILQV